MATRCQATNQAGQPCSAQHWQDGWCRWHHPSLEAERREWSRRGGANRSNKQRAKRQLPDGALSAAQLNGLLGTTLKGVLVGRVEPNVGNCVASLARAIRDVAGWADLDERLSQLEREEGRPA